MAEGAGFEPADRLPHRSISSRWELLYWQINPTILLHKNWVSVYLSGKIVLGSKDHPRNADALRACFNTSCSGCWDHPGLNHLLWRGRGASEQKVVALHLNAPALSICVEPFKALAALGESAAPEAIPDRLDLTLAGFDQLPHRASRKANLVVSGSIIKTEFVLFPVAQSSARENDIIAVSGALAGWSICASNHG